MEKPLPGSQPAGFESYEQAEITVDSITAVYEKWANQTVGRDRRSLNIFSALAEALRFDPRMAAATQEMIDLHQVMTAGRFETHPGALIETAPARSGASRHTRMPYPPYAANLQARGFWHDWRLNHPGWPDEFIDQDVCRTAVKAVLDDPKRLAELEQNVILRPVQSTIPSRAIGPKLILLAEPERFENPVIASVGHSLGLSEKKLLLNEQLPPVKMMDWMPEGDFMVDRPAQTYFLNRSLANPVGLAGCVAMDILPGDNDPASKEWALSSFTPKEQMDKAFMADVKRLANLIPENYQSLAGDFTLPEQASRVADALRGRKADVVLFSTVLYQLSYEDKLSMIKNALDILSDEGIIIVQDFVSASDQENYPADVESALGSLHFPSEWGQWSYRTLVMDPSRNGLAFREVLHFNDGRCGRVRMSKDYQKKLLGY